MNRAIILYLIAITHLLFPEVAAGGLLERPPPLVLPVVEGQPPALPGPWPLPAPGLVELLLLVLLLPLPDMAIPMICVEMGCINPKIVSNSRGSLGILFYAAVSLAVQDAVYR